MDADNPSQLEEETSVAGVDNLSIDDNINTLYAIGSISSMNRKLFKPSILSWKNIQHPTEIVYKEANSRAAPRKGTEPRAFLAIGVTKEEQEVYVGRNVPLGENGVGKRQLSPSSTKDCVKESLNVEFARMRSASSRLSSAHFEKQSTSGSSVRSVVPPQVLPAQVNAYIQQPFKQDHTHGKAAAVRPVSPSEKMKQATLLATYEVGKIINQREKTPKQNNRRQPRLLKGKLRPLNTVDVDGPSIYHCRGIQSDKDRFNSSPMKLKHKSRFDAMIKKNSAIKIVSASSCKKRLVNSGYSNVFSLNSGDLQQEDDAAPMEPMSSPCASAPRIHQETAPNNEMEQEAYIRGERHETRKSESATPQGLAEQQIRSVSAVSIKVSTGKHKSPASSSKGCKSEEILPNRKKEPDSDDDLANQRSYNRLMRKANCAISESEENKSAKPMGSPSESAGGKNAALSSDAARSHNQSNCVQDQFSALEEEICKVRSLLRRSYSLGDIESLDFPLTASDKDLSKMVQFMENKYVASSDENLHLALQHDKLDGENVEPQLHRVKVQEDFAAPSSVDNICKELASRDSEFGFHGEISNFLLNKTLIRTVYPKDYGKLYSAPSMISACPSPSAEVNYEPCKPVCTHPEFDCSEVSDSSGLSVTNSVSGDISFLKQLLELLPEQKELHVADANTPANSRAEDFLDSVEGRRIDMKLPSHPSMVVPIASVPPVCFRINCLPPENCLFYFAYNSDMNSNRLAAVLRRDVKVRLWAVLFGFRLVFNKKGVNLEAGLFANLEHNPYSSTEGHIYCLTNSELAILDGCYGYPEHYGRAIFPVWTCNSSSPDEYNVAQYCVPAVTYIAQDKWLHSVTDSPASYALSLRQCMNGSEQLTGSYRKHLSSLLESCA